MPSRINIGIRHVLPIYIGLAILAAVYAVDGMRRWRTNPALAGIVAALMIWLTASVALSHPDYLPYFNALAGPEPEKVLVDSDLDWGQDLRRMAHRLHELGVREVAVLPPFPPPERDLIRRSLDMVGGFPAVRDLDPLTPSSGWRAISLTLLRSFRMGAQDTNGPLWPDRTEPTERVGKGLLLYYFPPAEAP